MTRYRAGVCALVFSAGFMCSLAFAFASAAGAAASNKPYSLVICTPGQTCSSSQPAVVSPGSASGTTPAAATMTAAFTNENKAGSGISLGSANLTPPSGFSVTGTDLPACPPSVTQGTPRCAYLAGGGTLVEFRNLNLPPGGATSVSMSVATPAPSATACTTSAPCNWTDAAKQSNDFNGTGNDLSLDSATSALGTVMSGVTSCSVNRSCQSTLADGGTATSVPASISSTITASAGTTPATLSQSLNYGQPYACQYFPEPGHQSTYWNLSGGTDRSKTVSVTTTVFPAYQQEVCFDAPWSFTQKIPSSTGIALLPAATTTAPDGSGATWYIGLLPDCGSLLGLQVNPSQQPCVVRSQASNNGITSTTVFSVPAGKPGDPTHYN